MQQAKIESENSFLDKVSEMKQKLVKDDLYLDGCVYITYDRNDHRYHLCESTGVDGIPADEYPNSEEYCQIRIIEVSIEELDEAYSYFENENNLDDINTEQREEIIDNFLNNTLEQMEMDADKKAALFELDLIEGGKYISELHDYVNKHNESLGNLNYHLKELGILKEVRLNILEQVSENVEVFEQ